MFLTARKAAFAGIILAISIILLVLGGVFEMSTLFFLAAAAFCIGIIIREFGLRAGAAYLAASLAMGLFLAPNKLYVLTYGAMELYIFLRELLWEKCKLVQGARGKYLFFKWLIFQPLFLPLLIFAPQLFYGGELSVWVLVLLALGGELVWLVADTAYDIFQSRIWARMRRLLGWRSG